MITHIFFSFSPLEAHLSGLHPATLLDVSFCVLEVAMVPSFPDTEVWLFLCLGGYTPVPAMPRTGSWCFWHPWGPLWRNLLAHFAYTALWVGGIQKAEWQTFAGSQCLNPQALWTMSSLPEFWNHPVFVATKSIKTLQESHLSTCCLGILNAHCWVISWFSHASGKKVASLLFFLIEFETKNKIKHHSTCFSEDNHFIDTAFMLGCFFD